MCRKLSLFVYLLLFSFSVSSQEIQNHIFIKNDSIILHQDTLLIGKTILSDILTKSQIDSLGSPIISHWDGDCDSGTDYEYWINKNNYKTVFVKDSKGKYILNAFSLALTNQDSVFLDDYLNVNNLSYKKILALDLKKDHNYRNNDSLEVYRKEGMTLTFYRSKDNLELKLIHIHPKNWDQYLKQKIVKGDVRNAEGESLPGVLFLAYNKFDSLKYYEMTDIDGKYFFEIDSVKEIDVFNFKYEPQTIKILDNNDQTINFKLKKKIYYLPDLVVTKKGEILVDSICYLEQFPRVRDSSKINVWLGCEFINFNPLIYRIPSVAGGIKHSYEELVSNLSRKNKLRRCTAKVNLVIYKNGLTQLQNVVCDDKINEELLARYIFDAFKWTPARWRGRPINSNWSLKIIFE